MDPRYFFVLPLLGLSLWRFGSQYKGVGYPLDLRYDRFISNKGKASGHILFPMTYRTGVHNIVSKTIFPLQLEPHNIPIFTSFKCGDVLNLRHQDATHFHFTCKYQLPQSCVQATLLNAHPRSLNNNLEIHF